MKANFDNETKQKFYESLKIIDNAKIIAMINILFNGDIEAEQNLTNSIYGWDYRLFTKNEVLDMFKKLDGDNEDCFDFYISNIDSKLRADLTKN